MILTYAEKLTVIRKAFVDYVGAEIERQEKIGQNIPVPSIPNYQNDMLDIIGIVPVMGNLVRPFHPVVRYFHEQQEFIRSERITRIVYNTDREIKLILKESIREIVILFKSALDNIQEVKALKGFAAASTVRLFNFLAHSDNSNLKFNIYTVKQAILEGECIEKIPQNIIFNTQSQFPSDYKIISELDLLNYANAHCGKNKNKLATVSIKSYLRFAEDTKVILHGGISPEIRAILDLTYANLNGCDFSYSDFSGVSFNDADIRGTFFYKAELVETKFFGALMPPAANFRKAQGFNFMLLGADTQLIDQSWKNEAQRTQIQECSFYNARKVESGFIGKIEELNKLHRYFAKHEYAVQVIVGDGGVGKTQTALKYIREYKEEYSSRVRWISAESKDALDLSYRKFAKDLGISVDKKNDEDVVKMIKKILNSELQKTLLVFDNVNNYELVQNYLPDQDSLIKHHVIITAKNRLNHDFGNYIDLSIFSHQEAIEYVIHSLGLNDVAQVHQNKAQELVELYNYHPLSLSQCISYIKNNELTIQDYLDSYKATQKDLLQIGECDDNDNIRNIYITLSMSLPTFDNQKAVELLKICAYLNPRSIPEYIFNSMFNSRKEKNDALAILKGYSFLSIKTDRETTFLYIHGLVQKALQRKAENDHNSIDFFKKGIELIRNQMTDRSIHDRQMILSKNEQMLPHALSLLEYYRSVIIDIEIDSISSELLKQKIARLYIDCGNVYSVMAHYKDSIAQYNYALSTINGINTNDNILVAEIKSLIGDAYKSLGQNNEALKEYEEVLQIRKLTIRDEENDKTADIYDLIGGIYKTLGRNNEALGNYNAALQIRKNRDESAKIAESLTAIGSIYHAEGKEEEALIKYETALYIKRAIHGDNHPTLAATIGAIANVYKALKRFNEALIENYNALRIKEATPGDNKIDIAFSLHEIGNVYCGLKKYKEALEYYEKALEIRQALNKKHPYVAATLNGIGNVFHAQGKEEEALIHYNEALHIRKVSYGNDHPKVAVTYKAIGDVYYTQKNLHEAMIYYNEALRINKVVYDCDHHKIVGVIQAIGKVYLELGNNKNALIQFEQAYSMQLKKTNNIDSDKYVSNTLAQINQIKYDIFLDKLTLVSFTIKNAIEAGPTIKYIFYEILLFPLVELPEFLNNNYVWIGIHYSVSNIGAFSITGKINFITPLASTSIYAVRTFTYEYLAMQKQESLEHSKDKSIKSSFEFFQKCGFYIAAQSTLDVLDSFVYGTPPIFAIVNGAIGGVQCYHMYNQDFNSKKEVPKFSTEFIIPYIADTLTAYTIYQNMYFDFSNKIGGMIAVKQGLSILNTVVMTDYMTKQLLSTYKETCVESINNITGKVYDYFIGATEDHSEL